VTEPSFCAWTARTSTPSGIQGCWHSHASVREPILSEDDLSGWRDCARVSRHPWIGVIAYSADGSWIAPELRAWVTYRDEDVYLTVLIEITKEV
jgi:hypothetical protein